MNIEAFENSPSGRLVRTPRGYYAYIPNPLPPEIDSILDMPLLRLATDAERALGNLAGIGYLVPNPDFLVIPYTRLEAIASSRIEGTQAWLSELFYFEAAAGRPEPRDDVREVQNYLSALNYGLERLKTLPLSLRLTRELHERMMANTRGSTPDRTPGEYRRSQNWIGPPGCTLEDATFVPPPPGELMPLLGNWEDFIQERDELPLLVQCALMHYQFEAIHPFLDGNGRLGRLLITLLMCERGALAHPLLYLSAYFEQNRDEYYNRLLSVSSDGDWRGWLQFFLQGVITQSNHAIESATRIIDEREKYRQELQRRKVSPTTLGLLDLLFTYPYFNTTRAAQKLNVTFNTAQSAIYNLIEAGILEEVTGQRRNRIYLARSLIRLLVENEPVYRPTVEEEV
jgi:Fic family protein